MAARRRRPSAELDVVLAPGRRRPARSASRPLGTSSPPAIGRQRSSTAAVVDGVDDGTSVRLPDSKGLRYLAELVRPARRRAPRPRPGRPWSRASTADGASTAAPSATPARSLDATGTRRLPAPHRGAAGGDRRCARRRAPRDGRGAPGRARPARRPARARRSGWAGATGRGVGGRAGPPQRDARPAHGHRPARRGAAGRRRRARPRRSAPACTASTSRRRRRRPLDRSVAE